MRVASNDGDILLHVERAFMQESTRLRMQGNWQVWKGRIQSKWGDLSDDDLAKAEGDVEVLVGIIKQRTGQSMQDIDAELDQMASAKAAKEWAKLVRR